MTSSDADDERERLTLPIVQRFPLHDEPDEIAYWLTRPVAERIAAVEVLRQRVYGYNADTRMGLQRVCCVIHRT